MCFDPVTLLAISTAITTAAAVAQGQAAQQAGSQQRRQAEWTAEAQRVGAGETAQAGARDEARQQTVNRLRMGQARVSAAASGLAVEGSPLEVLAFNAGQQALDVDAIATQGERGMRDLLAEAELSRVRGRTAQTKGRSEAAGAYARAGTALLTAAGNWQRPAPAAPRAAASGRG